MRAIASEQIATIARIADERRVEFDVGHTGGVRLKRQRGVQPCDPLVVIVVYHRRAGRGYLTTVALALLLGGAIGNLVDRLRYGSVVDFVDMGIGTWRFFTYNIGDAAITTAIVLLIGMALLPRLAEWGADD